MNLLCTILGITCTAGTIAGSAYVLDGDTISIHEAHVRLAGIDAEELSEPNGYAAKEHLQSLTNGQSVTCHWDGWSYNRRVGICFTTTNLNEQMIRDGFALDCYHYSNGRYRQLEPPSVRSRLIQKGYCK